MNHKGEASSALARVNAPHLAARGVAWIGSWLLAGLAWIPTMAQAWGMPATPGTMGMSLVAFLGFWTLMMAAMMLPSLAPVLTLHLEAMRLPARGWFLALRMGALVLGYLLIWSAFGLPMYGLALAEMALIRTAPLAAVEAEAIILVAAGLYQLTPLQARCLAMCRQHAGRPSFLSHGAPFLQDMETGLQSGLECLCVCGGLMLLLVLVGFMNLAWMLVITFLVVLEKAWRYGPSLSLVVGIGLLVLGILVAGSPGVLPGGLPGTVH